MKKATTLLLIVSLVLVDLSPALADDTEIFGTNIQPNVMILFDTSGSMKDSIGTFIPYDGNTAYPGTTYTSAAVYRQQSSTTYTVYANSIAAVSSATARAALATNGFWSGKIGGSSVNLFVGNYLNYQTCSSCDGVEPKIVIAKRIVTNLITNTEGVRFGVMIFANNEVQGQGGGKVVAPIGANKTTMVNAITAIAVSGYTPLGEIARDAGLYYKGQFGFPSPIQYACQTNFVVLMTDGLQNGKLDLRVEAKNLFTQDHSDAFPGTQNVIVDTIGFGVSADEKSAANDVLQVAAKNGGGTFYTADNSVQLERALQDAIRRILAVTFTFATPAIPTTSTTGSTRTYLASLKSDPSRPFWRGFLKAYQRDANGLVPVDSNGVPLDSALVWEAGQLLSQRSSKSRTIYTAVGGTRQEVTKSNGAITPALLGAATTTERDQIIDFTRGVDAFDEDNNGNVTEERGWKLGDVFHSSPVLVTPPFFPRADPDYAAFQQANAGRTPVVIVGANDGTLHAFRESDGAELWAFLPPDLLGRVKNLAVQSAPHAFYLDASSIAADIKIGGVWKTIVVFGERRGGPNYHALDITDTANPLPLWSFTDPKMGETWSDPAIGKVMVGETEKFVAFVGGGFDSPQNNALGKAFFVLDLATGQKLWAYSNDGSLDDRRYMNFSLAANPTAVDLNNDGFVDRVYIGDVGGQLWKFDVSAAATLSGGLVTNWTGKRLFAADPSQPNPPPVGEYYPAQAIYAPPDVAFDGKGNLWVYFGTGDRDHPTNASANRFYGLKDTTGMANGNVLTGASLVDVSSGSADASAGQGWFFRLGSGEKVWAAADVFNGIVFFSTFTPTTTACTGGGGNARLYEIQMLTGYAALDWATGQPLTATDGSKARSTVIGTGIASRPIMEINDSGGTVTTTAITATTSQQLTNSPAPPPPFMKRLLYWTERF